MTLNQINYFIAVAEHLNFTKAAASLFITQSTLSRSIAALENELGVTLLVRDFHSVKLTPAGELMFHEMRAAMSSVSSIIRRVQALGGAENDRFVIGTLEGETVNSEVLSAIRTLSDEFPYLNVDIRRAGYNSLIRDVNEHYLDAAIVIVADDTVLDPELDYLFIKKLPLFLIAQRRDPIWDQSLSLEAFSGKTLLLPEETHPGLDAICEQIFSEGVPMVVQKCSDFDTLAMRIEAGLGVYFGDVDSVIYNSSSFRPVAAVRLENVPEPSEILIWNKSNRREVIRRFISCFSDKMDSDT